MTTDERSIAYFSMEVGLESAVPSVGDMAVQLITLFVAQCLYCTVKE